MLYIYALDGFEAALLMMYASSSTVVTVFAFYG